MQDTRPFLLVSNDDGHSSHFLRVLVNALCERFDVCVVAPLEEQSWVGRAMTRRGLLEAHELTDWPCEAWAVSGRPADCVNLGLNHLIKRRPDAVVSGINIGFNASLPLILGSGTVAAATEGALAGLPAFALSLALLPHEFATISSAQGRRDTQGEAITQRAAQRATTLIAQLLQTPSPPYSVHNINFPAQLSEDAPITRTEVALSKIPSLFKVQDSSETTNTNTTRHYTFCFASQCNYTHNPETSDIKALSRGEISHTLIQWNHLSKTL